MQTEQVIYSRVRKSESASENASILHPFLILCNRFPYKWHHRQQLERKWKGESLRELFLSIWNVHSFYCIFQFFCALTRACTRAGRIGLDEVGAQPPDPFEIKFHRSAVWSHASIEEIRTSDLSYRAVNAVNITRSVSELEIVPNREY